MREERRGLGERRSRRFSRVEGTVQRNKAESAEDVDAVSDVRCRSVHEMICQCKSKTNSRRDSHVVTDRSTNRPVRCLSSGDEHLVNVCNGEAHICLRLGLAADGTICPIARFVLVSTIELSWILCFHRPVAVCTYRVLEIAICRLSFVAAVVIDGCPGP